MSETLPGTWGGLLLLLPAAALSLAILRHLLRRRAARERVVELPNSHYTSPLVRDTETRHYWHSIPLDQVHEINRAEVARLLAQADAGGVESLRPAERTFIEQLAASTGTQPPVAPAT
jgi:hypothetical protein